MEKETVDGSKTKGSLTQRGPGDSSIGGLTSSCPAIDADVRAATFLDVAVLRCLFVPQWQEEGVHWALQFLYHRHVWYTELIKLINLHEFCFFTFEYYNNNWDSIKFHPWICLKNVYFTYRIWRFFLERINIVNSNI